MIVKVIVIQHAMADAEKPVLEHVAAAAWAPVREVVPEVVRTLVQEVPSRNHLRFSISLQVMNTINKHNMKRISFIIALQVLFSILTFAQLSKFKGTWVHHYVTKCWNSEGGEGTCCGTKYLRIDVVDSKVYIREKDVEETRNCIQYYSIRDIITNGDSLISYKRFYEPDNGVFYFEKDTPNTRKKYDYLKQYRIVKVRHSGVHLDVSWDNTYLEFYKNRELIDKKELHSSGNDEYYNEKDNW